MLTAKRLGALLSEHYIILIECDHENKRDRAICNCAKWEAPWCESPVAAAQAWAKHVQQVYEEKAADVALTYTDLIEPIRTTARALGYAIGLHGSLARDIDLIAIPWTEEAVAADVFAEAVRKTAEDVTGHTAFVLNDPDAKPLDYIRRSPEPKAHGRLGWSIHIAGLGTYIDLSVMPAGQTWLDAKNSELQRRLEQAYDEILRLGKDRKDAH